MIANEDRLAAYDRASNADATAQYRQGRQELEGEKFNFQQQKEAFLESQRLSDAQQRASQFETRNQRLLETSQAVKDLHQAQFDSLKAQREAEMAMMTQKMNDSTKMAESAKNIVSALGGLDPKSQEFRAKFSKVVADNIEGLKNEKVGELVNHQFTTHDNWLDAQAKAAAISAKPVTGSQQLEDALAASHPTYGYVPPGKPLDEKNFVPTVSGATGSAGVDEKGNALPTKDANGNALNTPQPHVLTTYVGPGGKTITQVFPRDAFDASVAASQARSKGNAGPTGAPAEEDGLTPGQLQAGNVNASANASPALPAPPQNHIDYLKANPNAAGDFDQKYGQGASQQYLAPPAQ